MRTDPASVDQTGAGGCRTGGLDPIRLAFATSVLVYPMRISAISAPAESRVINDSEYRNIYHAGVSVPEVLFAILAPDLVRGVLVPQVVA